MIGSHNLNVLAGPWAGLNLTSSCCQPSTLAICATEALSHREMSPNFVQCICNKIPPVQIYKRHKLMAR